MNIYAKIIAKNGIWLPDRFLKNRICIELLEITKFGFLE